jgi:queuine tRNA-ribosyltransferase
MNATYAHDTRPMDETCSCYTCQNFSRAYLRHLISAKEMLSATLISIHNIHTLLEIARRARQAIFDHRYTEFCSEFLNNWLHRSTKGAL